MWQQLTIAASSRDSEELEALLLVAGARSITYLDAEDQPVFQEEPGSTLLWDNTLIMALFDADSDLQQLTGLLKKHPAVLNADSLQAEILEDQAWEKRWMEHYHPMRFGSRLWICPGWQEPPDKQAVNLLLDPGLAFGSGTHNTTAMCLRWLDQAAVEDTVVIDYGCGSGVLAIAAALLGARQVHGVDNDPQAISATRDNAARNRVGSQQLSTWLPEQLPALQADILLANILAAPLIDLAARFAGLLSPGGHLVLSGLLDSQIDAVSAAYRQDFDLDTPIVDGDWACLTGKRRA